MKLMRTIATGSVALALLAGCGPRGGKQQTVAQSVAVETVRAATVTRTVSLIGAVEGEHQAVAMSKVTGRVTDIEKPEGSWVNADEPIAWVVNDIPGMDYKPGPVRSPIAGVVGKVYVAVGQAVAPAVPVAVVADFGSRVNIKGMVSDADLRFVRVGARADVSVAALPDTVFAGRVTAVSSVLDQLSRTATVELTVDNRGRQLVPGMACGVRLTLEEKPAVIALPLTALFTNGLSKVAVLDGKVARLRDVVTGLAGDDLIEVLSGVQAGEKVITTGKERIKDGDEVNAVEATR